MLTPAPDLRKPKLLERVREIIRLKHYSLRSEKNVSRLDQAFYCFSRKAASGNNGSARGLEARATLGKMRGMARLMAQLLYGCGLRLNECARLRVKDVDFGYLQITIRDAKGGRDRVTMLPVTLVEPLRRQIEQRRLLHEEDLAAGLGAVFLPGAIARKYPNAPCEFAWQYIFASARTSSDPRADEGKPAGTRHHV